MTSIKQQKNWLRSRVVKISAIHFAFVFAYIGQIIIYDAWKLITPEVVLERWLIAAMLLIVNTAVWYLARSKETTTGVYKGLAFALITADILMASTNVYIQRGMASRAVALYAIPIIVSAALLSRVALLSTAVLCIAAYTTTAVAYFVLNFNEGYKVELYGEVITYCIYFLLLASLLWAVVRHPKQ